MFLPLQLHLDAKEAVESLGFLVNLKQSKSIADQRLSISYRRI
jgi:hypothetical protein